MRIHDIRQRVEIAAPGGYMTGSKGKRVVRWDPDGRNVTTGPGIICIMYVITIKTINTLITIISSIQSFFNFRIKIL